MNETLQQQLEVETVRAQQFAKEITDLRTQLAAANKRADDINSFALSQTKLLIAANKRLELLTKPDRNAWLARKLGGEITPSEEGLMLRLEEAEKAAYNVLHFGGSAAFDELRKIINQPEPCICITNINDTDPETGEKLHCSECNGTGTIPPADVAELQQQLYASRLVNDTQRTCIAELERKLAKQQAVMAHAYVTLNACEESDEPSHGVAEAVRVLSKVDCTEFEVMNAEAREEGRKDAVPDGWQVVPKELTEEMIMEGNKAMKGQLEPAMHAWDAMLAAAPSPSSLNAKEGGE